MAAHFFDDLDDGQSNRGHQKPFWALDFKSEGDEELLEWLNAELNFLLEQAKERHFEQKKNLAAYRGIQYGVADGRSRDEAANDSAVTKRSKNPRVIYNHLVDITEQDVARMTKYRGAVSATPASDDNSDRIVAEIAEELVEKFWDKVGIDKLLPKHRRRVRIMSENFIGCFWHRNAGPYDREWLAEALRAKGVKQDPREMKPGELRKVMRDVLKEIPRLPLIDPDSGKQMEGRDGKPLWIDRPMRKGDVVYPLIMSWDMLLQRVADGDYAKVEYGMFRERLKVDTVRAMHPSKADKIEPESQSHFDLDTCEEVNRSGEVEVWHLYHKSTDLLDQGRYIKFTRKAILINRANPYLGWDERAILPWVRTVDIDTPAVLNGDATVTHLRGPQAVYNNLVSLRVRNRFKFSHPKWFYPANSVNKDSLGNTTSMVAYKGAVPPTLSQPQIHEGNESEMMQNAEQTMQKIGGVYGVSRGDPPKGITAAVALTFLDEQENDRANVGINDQTAAIEDLALMTLWLMADNYDRERLADLLGKTRAAQLDSFEMANLRDVADLRIQSSTALPQQKAQRLQTIFDIKERFPMLLGDDQATDLLGLGEEQRLRNIVTVAIRKADDENERLMNGVKTDAPLRQEMHLQHYRIHRRQMNEIAYTKLPKGDQQAFEEHTMAHEYELWQMGLKNPGAAQAISAEFPDFPVFYVPSVEEMMPQGPALPQAPMMPPADGMQVPPPMQSAMPQDLGMPPGTGLEVPPPEATPPGAESLMPQGV